MSRGYKHWTRSAEGSRLDWHATSFETDNDLYEDISDVVTKSPLVDVINNSTEGFVAAVLQPISSRVAQFGEQNGGNTLGLASVNQTWFAIVTGWGYQADDLKVHNAGDAIVNAVSEIAQTRGKHIPYIFMNDASWNQDVLGSYGAENVQRLKDVRARYDPDQVFQKLVPGGFKL